MRRVPVPDELVPTGEALLAVPPTNEPGAAPPHAEPVAPADAAPPSAPPSTPGPASTPSEPRVRIEALLGTRVSGPGATGWGTGELRALFPISEWELGFWARYDLVLAGPRGAPQGFSADAVTGGFVLGRRLVRGPFELHVSLDPALTIVRMEAGEENAPHPEGDRVTFRIGAMATGSFRLANMFRGVISMDAEFAPAGFVGVRRIQATLPPVPTFSAGLLLGVEAAIR
jgi:hypothetical protein